VWARLAATAWLGAEVVKVENPQGFGDPRFDTAAARLKHEPEVDAMIAAWTRQARQTRGDARARRRRRAGRRHLRHDGAD
jgi:crotonobetainyl-CoA:carnitine CoA-transferase CaiB-like acyl-CoA transferase